MASKKTKKKSESVLEDFGLSAAVEFPIVNSVPGNPHHSEGFDPHEYYEDWEDQFRSCADLATPIEIQADLIMAMGFNLKGAPDDPKVKKWEEAKKILKFDARIRKAWVDRAWAGNGFNPIVAAKNKLGIRLQEIHPKYMYPNADKSNELVGWYFIKFGGYLSPREIKAKSEETGSRDLTVDNVIHIAGERIGEDILGMPIQMQSSSTIDNKERLENLLGPMAFLQTIGLLHTKTNCDNLPTESGSTGDLSSAQKKINSVSKLFANRVSYDSVKKTIKIYSNVSTDDRTTATAIPITADFAGLIASIEMLRKKCNMKSRVYQVFQGYPEDANRATSYIQLLPQQKNIEAEWKKIATEVETKILPRVGLEGESLYFNAVIKDDELKWAQILAIFDAIKENGGLDLPEFRALMNDLFDMALDINKKIEKPQKAWPLGQFPISAPKDSTKNPDEPPMPSDIQTPKESSKGKMQKEIRPVLPQAEKTFTMQQVDDYTRRAELEFKTDYIKAIDGYKAQIEKTQIDSKNKTVDIKLNPLALEKVLYEHAVKIYNDAQLQLKSLFGMSLSPEQDKYIHETARNDAKDKANSMESEARRIILDDLNMKKSMDEIATDLQSVFADYTGAQLDAIARTMIMDYYNLGRFDLAEQSNGFVVGWYYNSILDDRTTPCCRTLNGLYFRADDTMIERIRPPNHWSCRSILTPILKTDNISVIEWANAIDYIDLPQEGFK